MIFAPNCKVIVLQRQASASAYDEDSYRWVQLGWPELTANRQPAGNKALERAGLTAEERVVTFFINGSHDLDPNDMSLAVTWGESPQGIYRLPDNARYRYELQNVEPWSGHTEVLAIRREVWKP